LTKVFIDQGRDVAETCEALDAVVDANEAVVTGVRLQVILLHDVLARSRHRHAVAAVTLQAGAHVWASFFSTGTGMDTATNGVIALEAGVLGHIAVENFPAQQVLRAATRKRDALADAPATRG
jgi:hypothetical protein